VFRTGRLIKTNLPISPRSTAPALPEPFYNWEVGERRVSRLRLKTTRRLNVRGATRSRRARAGDIAKFVNEFRAGFSTAKRISLETRLNNNNNNNTVNGDNSYFPRATSPLSLLHGFVRRALPDNNAIERSNWTRRLIYVFAVRACTVFRTGFQWTPIESAIETINVFFFSSWILTFNFVRSARFLIKRIFYDGLFINRIVFITDTIRYNKQYGGQRS